MVEPTKECIEYVNKTNAELWKDKDNTFYVVYPTAREAHKHGEVVLKFTEIYDVGAFEVCALGASVLNTVCAERLL